MQLSLTSASLFVFFIIVPTDVCTFMLCGFADSTKCYVCDSETTKVGCSENFFTGAITSTVADGCDCCTKQTTDGVTRRECITGVLSTAQCVEIGSKYVCKTDHCNSAPVLLSVSLTVCFSVLLPLINFLLQ